MRSRILILSLLWLPIATVARGQDTNSVTAKVTEATVYFRGAELVHTASATLRKGENELVIKGLSPQVDANSLKIKATNNVVVSASEFSIDYLIDEDKRMSSVARKMNDSISHYTAMLERINVDIRVNNSMIDYLNTGITKNVSGSEAGLGIDELVKTMDYFRTKSEELHMRRIKLENERRENEKSLQRVRSQYNQEVTRYSKTAGTLKLRLSAPIAAATEFTVTYFTSQAGWTPYYDINISSVDAPVKFVMKSKVSQTTGLDWEKVKLALSTAQPSNGKTAPIFSAWFLKQWTPSAGDVGSALQGYVPGVVAQNSISYSDKQMEEVVITGYSRARGTTSSSQPAKPMYVINGQVATEAEYTSLDPNVIKNITVLKDSEATSLYGSSASGGAVIIETKGMDDYVSSTENDLNIVYNIDMPYNIPGSGKAQNIDLQTKTAPAEYKYYCAPKLDPQTYLLAEISDWEQLGLVSGNANVTYEGTYIGQTYIDAASTQSKINLTLGTDKRVAVKREVLREYSATRAIGSDTQQTFAYRLTVRNNQTKGIKMIVKDQYPISGQKNIEVTLDTKQTTPWSMNREDVGVITWETDIAAGQIKEYIINYTVKYPKNMVLNF